MRTGPTICTISGLCVPGASCVPLDRPAWCVCFAPLPCANNATAMPKRQRTEAIKTRRLKKADCDVDFFFMLELHLNRPFSIKAPRKIKSFYVECLPLLTARRQKLTCLIQRSRGFARDDKWKWGRLMSSTIIPQKDFVAEVHR